MKKFVSVLVCVHLWTILVFAQGIPAPKDVLGFTPGDDRKLASWNQVLTYFQKLDAASPRVKFEVIGKTTMGVPFVYATISAPENLARLEYYKQINAKLADPRLIKSNPAIAKKLIKDGKTIVLITCGIHSDEVGSYLSSLLIAHRLATSTEPEIQKILRDTIILLVPSLNPDGVDIIKNWYDKTLGTPYEGTSPPELYHKYVGHDNNRDWYAFTQIETQLTVEKIHNVWHPQIVHDIHQQGTNGARLFLPPYMEPVEPNVPKQIVEGFTELGNFVADDLRKKGLQGITTNTTYDAWTPARAYSHYHGGVRILSETASCKLATPITVKFEDLRGAVGGLDPKNESAKFSPVWKGGEWKLRDITNYMTSAAFSLLNHAAANRKKWLTRFYSIGEEAVRPRKEGELFAFVFRNPGFQDVDKDKVRTDLSASQRQSYLLSMLASGGVTIDTPLGFRIDGRKYPEGTSVVKFDQPYGAFAKALIESQTYPDLKDTAGNPITPYDVTAHTLPLLMDVDAETIFKRFTYKQPKGGTGEGRGSGCGSNHSPRYSIYKSSIPSMDEGWTRWLFRHSDGYRVKCEDSVDNVLNLEIRKSLSGIGSPDTIIFPDQSSEQILNGFAKGTMPDEYTGGVGKEGVVNLKKFAEAGGTLIFLNRASNFAIEQFNLSIKDVTKGLARKDFFIPGSILRTELDTTHPIAKTMSKESIAWFENSPVFEIEESVSSPTVREGAANSDIKIIARYPSDPKAILLSGWALGAEKIAGKAALVEVAYGKGKIILFGFRPQYRGQSLATFPLFFNAIVR